MNQTALICSRDEQSYRHRVGVLTSRPVPRSIVPFTGSNARPATVHRIAPGRELTVCPEPRPREYRDAVCDLCEKIVSLSLEVPLTALQAKTRQSPDVALARQIAMYLCNTMFSVQFSDIGAHFGRDRTTASYACGLVEDKRDDLAFDVMMCQLESLLSDALDMAVALNYTNPREA